MMLTKSKIAMLLVSAAGALLVSHKHQQHHPVETTHTMSAITVTGSPAPAVRTEPIASPTPAAKVEEPCVCPPPTDGLGQR
jgi:hypothetical protein